MQRHYFTESQKYITIKIIKRKPTLLTIVKKKEKRNSKFSYVKGKQITSSGTMSRNLTSWERDTDVVRWYSTNSFNEPNFTTHKKNFPAASLKTLKC